MTKLFEVLDSTFYFLFSNFGPIGGFIIFGVVALFLFTIFFKLSLKVVDCWYLNWHYRLEDKVSEFKDYIAFRKEVSKKIKRSGKPYIHGKWKSGKWVEKSYYF